MADEPENLVLLQLQGMRREMAVFLERQVRDRELISKIYNELMAFRSEMREDIREVKGDLLMLENQMLNRHNEILGIIRRIDALGLAPD